MGTWTMDGTDVGFLVDLPCNRATDLLFSCGSRAAHYRCGGRFMCMETHHRDSDEIDRLRRELDELREQVKKQRAA